MSRIAYCICGLYPAGHVPAFNITDGWFWLFLPSSDVIPDLANFPFPFSLIDCVRNFWNVKTISVDVDVTYTPEGGDPTTSTDTGTFPVINGDGDVLSDEQQLIAVSELKFQGVMDGGITTFILTPSRLNIFSGDLYPQFQFNPGNLSFADTPGMTDSGIVASSNIPSINSQTLFKPTSDTGTYSGTVSINATEFWGYEGVFDTATGTQLIIPAPGGL